MLLLLYTTYYRQFRTYTASISSSTILSATTLQINSATWTTTSGIDQVGNAGQIPSSGAIQMNHFRGTNGSATSSNRFYGIPGLNKVLIPFLDLGVQSSIYGFAGHYGTNGSTGRK